MRRFVISLFVIAVVGVLFVVLCTFVKRPYEAVLLNRFGHLIPEQEQTHIAYGWYFKLPTDSVIRMDQRIHLFPNVLQEIPTSGSETISVRAFAAWRIADPVKFYQTTGASDLKAQQLLSQKMSGAVQSEVSAHTLDQFFNTDEKKVITTQLEDQIAHSVDGAVENQGMQVVQIGFSRMAFPPANAETVYERMTSERETAAENYRSEGESQAAAITAEGNSQASIKRSNAISQAEDIKGQGDALALKALQEVQKTPAAADFYQYWKSMQVMKSSFTKNTYLVLPTNTPWLKWLFVAPPEPTAVPATQPSNATIGMAPAPAAK
ncbi:MAG TPA: protease modulator HflC [Phycisphaerae bacterium]|nr:protease modulator HflC [Phycisphaerae bacterium]